MKLKSPNYSLKKLVLIATVCFFLICKAVAQPVMPNPKNAEAYALAKSLDYPMQNNTGVPNISIPLFDVSAGTLGYKVALSYHGGGVKVGQMPTWIGLNWSMNAAPQITRSINSLDDLTNGGYLGNNTISAYDPNKARPSNNILSRIARGELDEQPDEFNYSLMDKSGKFYYQKYSASTYKALTVPYDQLDIQYNKSTYQFTILDANGTKYEFGGVGYMEESRSSSSSPSITAWKCSRIISPNLKDTISFEYYPIQIKYRSSYVEQVELYDFNSGICPIYFDYQGLNPDITTTNSFRNNPMILTSTMGTPYATKSTYFLFAPPGNPVTYNFSSPNIYFDEAGVAPEPIGDVFILQNKALKSINFKGNKIEFFPKQRPDEILDSIRITNYLGEYIRTIKMGRTSTVLLDELAFSSGQDTESKYKFEYVPGLNNPETNLPSDAWGYPNPSNGYLNPTTLDFFNDSNMPFQWITGSITSDSPNSNQPAQELTIPIGRNNLESNEEDMKAGVIKKIIYPGGGYTEFEFEANRYSTAAYPHPIKVVGGLRIKSIKNFEGNTAVPATEKYYKYEANGVKGTGFVVIDPVLNNFEYLENGHWTHEVEREYTQGDYSNFRKRTFSKSTIDNAFFSDGSPVNYPIVEVYDSENGQQTGVTSYVYSVNHSNFRITNTPLTQHQLDIDNGQLLFESYSAYHNGQFEWVKTKRYSYETFYLPEKIHVGKVFNSWPLMGYVKGADPIGDYGKLTYLTYGLNVGYSRIIKETDSIRSLDHMDQKIGTVKNYYYDNNSHTYATRIESVTSNGDLISESTSYPQDYAADNAMISSLIANHKLNSPIESAIAKRSPENLVLSSKINLYDATTENYYRKNFLLVNDLPVPLNSFKFSNVSFGQWPNNQSHTALSFDSRFKEKMSVDVYDRYGNPVQFTNDLKKKNTFVWAYKGAYPVIEIKDMDYAVLENAIGVATLSNFVKSSPNRISVDNFVSIIRNLFPLAQITSYTYKPLVGITTTTDTKGMTTFFEYDIFQRLKNIKDQNGHVIKSYDYHYKTN